MFEKLKESFRKKEGAEPDYIEIDLTQERAESKVVVKTFVLKTYEDITPILNALREGYTIAVIDIKPLKIKDVVELKRAISKVKKTIEALEGTIAGFGENCVIASPPFARIVKGESADDRNTVKRDLADLDRF